MNPSAAPRPILVVDDNRDIHTDFDKVLCPDRTTTAAFSALESDLFGGTATAVAPVTHTLVHAHSGEEAATITRQYAGQGTHFAVAFIDMRMPPGWDGMRTMEELKKIDPDLQFVVCTAFSDYTPDQVCERLEIRGGILFLRKPFAAADLRIIVDRFTT